MGILGLATLRAAEARRHLEHDLTVALLAEEWGEQMSDESAGWPPDRLAAFVWVCGAGGGALAASRLIWARDSLLEEPPDDSAEAAVEEVMHRAKWAVTIAFCRRASKSRSGEKQAERVLAWGLEGDPRRGISGAGERLWKQHVRHGERGMEVADSAREPWFEQLAAWLCEPLARKDDTPSWVKFGHDVGRAELMAGVIECERLIGVHASTRTRRGSG